MNKAYLLIGGNLGDRMAYLTQSKFFIENQCGKIITQSSYYETEAWGMKEQPSFLNQVILIETSFLADELLTHLLSIEKHLGRERSIPLGPRTIDIDILYFNDEQVDSAQLTIPHPRMTERNFVLIPLNEIAPQFLHPVFLKTTQDLLIECKDPCVVYKKNDL
jgi:2-amino-4-hydroxy-6-hydroxymethyldihydropteridine diphosphokinase